MARREHMPSRLSSHGRFRPCWEHSRANELWKLGDGGPYEHSEQARAPHTRTEGRARVWGSEFTTKAATLQGGVIVVLRTLFAAALVVRRKYLIMVQRSLPAAPLVVRRRYLTVVPRPMPAAPRMHLIVMYRPLPTAPLALRCMYMAVVPGPMPAAVASRCCRRRSQQLACACGS
jgi:hypothetical protein